MWHKAIWNGHPMRLELTHVGLLAELANHYTTRGALMFAALVVLDGFHLLLSTQLTADLTPEWSSGSMFHPLSQIYAKTPFCCIKTVANNTLNCQRAVVLDRREQTWHPLWTQLFHWQVFMQNGEYTVFWYLQPLCYHTQLQFTIDQNEFVEGFFVFFGASAEFGRRERSASFVFVRLRLKSAYPTS